MAFRDSAVSFECSGSTLPGIMHSPTDDPETGVVIVVGGPQYRVGSHRQFVLLGRALADSGIAVLRFDHRGIGDAEGSFAGFTAIEADIRAAIDCLQSFYPGVTKIFLWGLCDAASAALMYAYRDHRVAGIVALNPWVRTDSSYARTILTSYYSKRIGSKGFWKRILANPSKVLRSGIELAMYAGKAMMRSGNRPANIPDSGASGEFHPNMMLAGLQRFGGGTLIILSGDDLTADEFRTLVTTDSQWRKALDSPLVTREEVAGSNHTFSTAEWRGVVERLTTEWIKSF